MHLFLTTVLPFLAHDHPSAVSFLTCRHHNFHGSIIPEFLSDEERVKSFCEARQQDQLRAEVETCTTNLYKLFVQTPLMQFSPSLALRRAYTSRAESILKSLLKMKDCVEIILKPLLETKYFTRTLQRCAVEGPLSDDLLQGLSQVLSLTELDLKCWIVENQHLEIIVNCFPNLETLTIENAEDLDSTTAISISSSPPRATKTLERFTIRGVSGLLATQFVPHFTNLKKLVLTGSEDESFFDDDDESLSDDEDTLLSDDEDNALNLKVLSSALPLLADLSLTHFILSEVESLKHFVSLSSLVLIDCQMSDLSFLMSEEDTPIIFSKNEPLTTLCIDECYGFSKSPLASLAHASELRVLRLDYSRFYEDCFGEIDPLSYGEDPNKCLEYLDNMIHLRSLHLTISNIVGDSRSFKTLMQNLFQLEELNLSQCRIGNRGAIAGALYNTHSRLRVLNLECCLLADDDLNGIGALKNTLEELDVNYNDDLTNEALVHCRDLAKLRILRLRHCIGIDDLSPLKDCVKLEQLFAHSCQRLVDHSFKVFSEEPNLFSNLRVLELSDCKQLTEKVFEHLAKNNHLVYQLKELDIEGILKILSSSETARNNLCRLKGLRRLHVTPFRWDLSKDLELELLRELKNLEGF